ncbi:unnamed protein product [Trichobilharzia regenti]|nr:unnamed protein product [Trichobilharzia regenti]
MSTREAPASVSAIRNPNSQLAGLAPRPPLSDAALFSLVLTVREAGRRLAMSDYAIATACTILHRALRVLTTGDEQPNPIVATSNSAVNGSDALSGTLHKNRRSPLEVGEDYDRLRESLVQTELFLMRLLAYHVRRPSLPHPYLVHYLHSLLHWVGKGIAQPCGSDLSAPGNSVNASAIALARLPGLAWSILADTYQSSMCLDFAPEHIAAAVLHLALRIAGVEIPGNRHSEMAWWQAISDSLSREIVEQIQLRVMDIYAVDDKFKASSMKNFADEF